MHILIHVLATIATVIHAAQFAGVNTWIDHDAAVAIIKLAIAAMKLANLDARQGESRSQHPNPCQAPGRVKVAAKSRLGAKKHDTLRQGIETEAK